LPYAPVPFSINGSNAVVQQITDVDVFGNNIWLISGISNAKDVMRGEETQMVGLANLYLNAFSDKTTICIFPGTHSKHIQVQNRCIVDFQTYMTGELFSLMANYSILRDSISEVENNQVSLGAHRKSFQLGVQRSAALSLLHDLFSVRTNQVFNYLNKEENYFYLSGLLIGSELRSIVKQEVDLLVLCCGKRINHFYQLAMEHLGFMDKALILPAEIVDSAFIYGQVEIMGKQVLFK
jgi:2-dehydro-3-deoxygalactonokinase